MSKMALINNFFPTNSIILLALFLCITFVNVSSYINRTLESGKVCGKDSRHGEIILDQDSSSAVVISENGFFGSWTGRFNYKCSFTVRMRKDSDFQGGWDFLFGNLGRKRAKGGIYAVIQDLNFRKNSTTGECIDYISFRKPGGFFKTPKYKQYCGFLRPGTWVDESDYSDEDDVVPTGLEPAPNAFISNGSAVEVEIYVSNLRLEPNERLIVNLVFTAFHKEGCNARDQLKCKESECIWRGFKDDDYQNCPYTSCKDEESCVRHVDESNYFDKRFPKSSGIGTKVTIGAVASIIVMLILFAACLCICKRFGCLCWGAAQARRPPVRPPCEVERVLPSAPLEIETKDLPPSYDSLFPTQS